MKDKLVLDVGAGDRPYNDADVAVDMFAPARPANLKKPVWVIVSPSSKGSSGLPLQLSKTSQLKVYWVGDAKKLPDSWNDRFHEVKTNSALYSSNRENLKILQEMYDVLKDNGKVYIEQNTIGNLDRHIDNIENLLKKAGFSNVTSQIYGDEETKFTAVKRKKKRPVKKAKRKSKPTTLKGMR